MRVKKHYRKAYIVLTALLACIALYTIEQSIGVNYAIKTLLKFILFLGIPLAYMNTIEKSSLIESLNLEKVDKVPLKLGLLLGGVFFATVITAYLIARQYIDLDLIANDLQTKLKITPGNFIIVGVYITFGNSFLEEFFFRGFIFLNLYKLGYKRFSYILSSVLFGVYHVGIFKTWFTLPITLLALFGLISVGFLFNWMDTKSNNFINSWVAHIFADTAVILIGLRMFNII